jgi:ribosomal protein S18 acetylase RimI-like enzyme
MNNGEFIKTLEGIARAYRNNRLIAEILPKIMGKEITKDTVSQIVGTCVDEVNKHLTEDLQQRLTSDLAEYVCASEAQRSRHLGYLKPDSTEIVTLSSATALLVDFVNFVYAPGNLGLQIKDLLPQHTVRSAVAGDVPRLLELLKVTELFAESCDTEEAFQKKLAHDPDSIIVLESESEVIGMVVTIYDPWASFLWHLAIDPEHQAWGLGHHLANEAEARLRARGTSCVCGYVSTKNASSLSFFKRRGYEVFTADIHPIEKVLVRK